MGKDRIASLINQAALAGLLDCTRADPRSEDWWVQVKLAIDEVKRRSRIKRLELEQAQYLALLSASSSTEARTAVWKRLTSILDEMTQLLMPWQQEEREDTQANDVLLANRWMEIWGDPKDPAVAAKIKATADALLRGDRSRRAA